MITTTWQEAGFPDIRNVDYAVPMFVLSNATLEYNYMRHGIYSEENRENYLRGNCLKHLDPNTYGGLWNYYDLNTIIDALWKKVYLSAVPDGSFDMTGVTKESVVRTWTNTPSGPLICDSRTGTYFFLAEFARQAYVLLSGNLFAVLAVNRSYDSETETETFTVNERYSTFFDATLVNPSYRLFKRDSACSHGKIASGKSATFPAEEGYWAADGLVFGKPVSSFWVGKRV